MFTHIQGQIKTLSVLGEYQELYGQHQTELTNIIIVPLTILSLRIVVLR